MFAYPAGGDHGASTLTTGLVAAAIAAYLRRGSKTVLALLLTPFALGLIAAALGRYPYGGSARTMQYVAPSIILMAGLGAAVLLARLPRPGWRERSPRWVLGGAGGDRPRDDGLGRDAPLQAPVLPGEPRPRPAVLGRGVRRRRAALRRTDLRLPLDPLRWQGDRAVMYLCHQAIYSARHRRPGPPQLDRVSETHPLRVVVFNETPGDAAAVSRWIGANADRYELRAQCAIARLDMVQSTASGRSGTSTSISMKPAPLFCGVASSPAPDLVVTLG